MSPYAAEDYSQTLARTLQGMTEYMYEYDEDRDCVNYELRNESAEYSEADVVRCQQILEQYRDRVLQSQRDSQVIMHAIQTAVESLNVLNEACGHSLIETDQRESICQFMEEVIEAVGVDIDALAGTQGVGRHELTDQWREW